MRDGQIAGNLRLLDSGEEPSGSFQGVLGPGPVSGSVQLDDGAAGNFVAGPVVPDETAMAAVRGTWKDESASLFGINLQVHLDPVRRSMRAEGHVQVAKVVDLQGQWIATGDGEFWVLLMNHNLSLPPGVSVPPVPSEPVPYKGRYELRGDRLRLLDAFNPTKVITVLDRASGKP